MSAPARRRPRRRPRSRSPICPPSSRPSPPSSPTWCWSSAARCVADQLAPYGGRADVTPHLARLAAGGARFADAFTAAPWTKSAHTALLTGRYASSIGMVEPGEGRELPAPRRRGDHPRRAPGRRGLHHPRAHGQPQPQRGLRLRPGLLRLLRGHRPVARGRDPEGAGADGRGGGPAPHRRRPARPPRLRPHDPRGCPRPLRPRVRRERGPPPGPTSPRSSGATGWGCGASTPRSGRSSRGWRRAA